MLGIILILVVIAFIYFTFFYNKSIPITQSPTSLPTQSNNLSKTNDIKNNSNIFTNPQAPPVAMHDIIQPQNMTIKEKVKAMSKTTNKLKFHIHQKNGWDITSNGVTTIPIVSSDYKVGPQPVLSESDAVTTPPPPPLSILSASGSSSTTSNPMTVLPPNYRHSMKPKNLKIQSLHNDTRKSLIYITFFNYSITTINQQTPSTISTINDITTLSPQNLSFEMVLSFGDFWSGSVQPPYNILNMSDTKSVKRLPFISDSISDSFDYSIGVDVVLDVTISDPNYVLNINNIIIDINSS